MVKTIEQYNMTELAQPHNSTYKKLAVQWLNQALGSYQSLCLPDSEVLRNRHLRVAAKRWRTSPYHSKTVEFSS